MNKVAIKVNGKLTDRFCVDNVVMQGSVWGSLKCTVLMDKLNKMMMKRDGLQYHYEEDPNIPIGVLGMVDDTLVVLECGDKSNVKNAEINSFIQTNRLTWSDDKSVVLHVGSVGKCLLPCPTLKVHNNTMNEVESTKYLGNQLSVNGGNTKTVADRWKIGWGKVAQILGMVNSEMYLGNRFVEAGLLLFSQIISCFARRLGQQ